MSQPPEFYQQTRERYPDLFANYEALGEAAKNAGPLDARAAALIKLALSISSGLEGASHAHARRALSAGCDPDELRHVAILSVTTLGFPAMMRAKSWVEDVLTKRQ